MRRKIRRSAWFSHLRRMVALRRLKSIPRGSTAWLVETEIKYGGFVSGVARNRISPHDPRSLTTNSGVGTTGTPWSRGMQGGDRMLEHGYAPKYAQYLAPYLKHHSRLTIMEIGVLQGTGLAIWSDLFPSSRVIGLDVDLSHARANLAALKAMGAFGESDPELYEFDQYDPDSGYLETLLQGDRIDICIDDATHNSEAILGTLESVMPHMNDSFVYFVEDNATVCDDIRVRYPGYAIEGCGPLTILSHSTRSS